MSDRICEILASSAVSDSQSIIWYRTNAAKKGLPYNIRLLFDRRAGEAEAMMINRADRIIERLERHA